MAIAGATWPGLLPPELQLRIVPVLPLQGLDIPGRAEGRANLRAWNCLRFRKNPQVPVPQALRALGVLAACLSLPVLPLLSFQEDAAVQGRSGILTEFRSGGKPSSTFPGDERTTRAATWGRSASRRPSLGKKSGVAPLVVWSSKSEAISATAGRLPRAEVRPSPGTAELCRGLGAWDCAGSSSGAAWCGGHLFLREKSCNLCRSRAWRSGRLPPGDTGHSLVACRGTSHSKGSQGISCWCMIGGSHVC
jgi:hypothetical protein